MGWAPMEPDYNTCGMTNWVGSFDPIKFIYFMLATVLIPYPVYVFVATVFNWEHLAKRPARHYRDLLNATSYGVILFIFGNYAQTLNWITILAFWITWPCYSLIAELDFAKTSLPSFRSWPFGMYALFSGATAVVLAFAGYHIYLGIILNRTVPGFIGYYLLALLIPVLLTLIGYACLKQQNNDLFGLSKVYNFMLYLQWRWTTRVARRKAAKQRTLTIDPPAPSAEALAQHEGPSSSLSELESVDNTEVSVPPYQPYVWSVSVSGYFHPHHWQLFYILAFFTRFDHWVSRVGAGIVLGAYMQGIMDLRPETIYARFLKEFPECVDPSPTLRWRDNDGDWINIRQDDTDLEPILMQALEKKGYVHIQSADTAG
ncbi:hypothetical protein BGZ46_007265, partial [Entomortierella lignicola]